MNEPATGLLVGLARTTLLVAAAAVIVQILLWATRSSSPKARRVCWFLVLVQGWLWLRMPVAVPYYDPPPELPPAAALPSEPLPVSSLTMEEEGAGGWDSAQPAPSDSPSEHSLRSTPATQSPGFQHAAVPSHLDWARANWPLLLAAVWLAGMGVSAGRWLVRYVRFVRSLPRGRTAEEAWVRQWHDLLAAEGVRLAIPLRMTSTVGPMLCRLPTRWELLVPIDLWRGLTPERRLAVLRHELAHLKRHDAWKSLAARLLALPHWFNPASWWAVRKFDEAAEWACDRSAAGADHEQAVGYARTLLQLGAPSPPRLACGPAAQGRGLSVRVRRLLSPGTGEDSVMKRLFLITIALGLLFVCLLRFDLVAKEADATPEGTVAAVDEVAVNESKEPGGGPGSGAGVEVSGLSVGGGPKTVQPAVSSAPPSAKTETTTRPMAASDYAELVGETDGAAGSPGRGKVPLRSLRYDGKSFEEWRREWTTELKPERRAEAVTAFAAFGANGYGEEAAEAILEVMRQLEMSSDDAGFDEPAYNRGALTGNKLIKHCAKAAFLPYGRDFRIPPQDAVKVLVRELKTGGRNGRLFAIFALQNIGGFGLSDAIPALREAFQNDDDATVRCHAYVALVSLGQYVGPAAVGPPAEMPPSTLRELIETAEPDALRSLLGALVPHSGSRKGSVFQEKRDKEKSEDVRYVAGYPGRYRVPSRSRPPRELRPEAEPIVEVLVEALEGEREAIRREAIYALTRIGLKSRGVVPGLVRAFERGPASDRRAIFSALEDLARVKREPQPNMYIEEKEEYDLSAIQGEEAIPRLIQSLDPSDPQDVWLLGTIYLRFGPAAEEVKPILEKAAEDEDERVRHTAKSVLEAVSARERKP
jgi:beta-lactamase regulating signal transducer with metallopeptidase domain/HEAT repeat protein